MRAEDIHAVIDRLTARLKGIAPSTIERIAERGDPWQVLVATVLSLRTKDPVTDAASQRLFTIAPGPAELWDLGREKIARLIYPVGFYNIKSLNLLQIGRIILDRYGGKVPDEMDLLLELPGVGRKTANLVLARGYGIPAICVDTHVHRITNRWGYVSTKTPEKTEMALREKLPREHWIAFNGLLVLWGQNICKPTSPHCSVCPLDGDGSTGRSSGRSLCQQVGVNRYR